MTFSIETLGDEPILLVNLAQDFHVHDISHLNTQLRQILDSVDEPVFNIVDLRTITFRFQDVMMSTHNGAPIWYHPRIHQSLFVTTSRLLQLVIQGMHSPTFGPVYAFDTLDDALAYARSQVRQTAT